LKDGTPSFHAYCPTLRGARTQGKTQEEALQNIHDVVKLIVDQMIEDGDPIPPDIEIEGSNPSPAIKGRFKAALFSLGYDDKLRHARPGIDD